MGVVRLLSEKFGHYGVPDILAHAYGVVNVVRDLVSPVLLVVDGLHSFDQLVIGDDTLDDAAVSVVDAWSQTHETLAIVEHSVEAAEEWFAEDPHVGIVVLNRNKAAVLFADVHHKCLWRHLHVISVVDEQRNAQVLIEVTGPHQEVIHQLVLGLVQELIKHFGGDRFRDLDIRIKSVQYGLILWDVVSGLPTIFECWLVSYSEAVDRKLPQLVILCFKKLKLLIWRNF